MKDYRFDWAGNAELTDDESERSIYLQGEDANPIRELDDWLDEVEFPYGAYQSMQEAIDTILDNYFACIDE